MTQSKGLFSLHKTNESCYTHKQVEVVIQIIIESSKIRIVNEKTKNELLFVRKDQQLIVYYDIIPRGNVDITVYLDINVGDIMYHIKFTNNSEMEEALSNFLNHEIAIQSLLDKKSITKLFFLKISPIFIFLLLSPIYVNLLAKMDFSFFVKYLITISLFFLPIIPLHLFEGKVRNEKIDLASTLIQDDHPFSLIDDFMH